MNLQEAVKITSESAGLKARTEEEAEAQRFLVRYITEDVHQAKARLADMSGAFSSMEARALTLTMGDHQRVNSIREYFMAACSAAYRNLEGDSGR